MLVSGVQWFLINTYLFFVPISGTEFLKTLGISQVIMQIKVCNLSIASLFKPQSEFWKIPQVARENKHVIRERVGTFSPTPNLQRGEWLEIEPITNGQWSNQPCLCNETFIKIPEVEALRASGLVNLWRRFWEGGMPERAWRLSSPLPLYLPYTSCLLYTSDAADDYLEV